MMTKRDSCIYNRKLKSLTMKNNKSMHLWNIFYKNERSQVCWWYNRRYFKWYNALRIWMWQKTITHRNAMERLESNGNSLVIFVIDICFMKFSLWTEYEIIFHLIIERVNNVNNKQIHYKANWKLPC